MNTLHGLITVPAASLAMGVTRTVLERAIKAGLLKINTFHTGGNNGGFRLIQSDDMRHWLAGRGGYHACLKGGATQFTEWGPLVNPDTIVAEAVSITITNKQS